VLDLARRLGASRVGSAALSLVFIVGWSGLAPSASAAPSLNPTPVPTTARTLGVYVHNSAWDPSLLDRYASTVGRMPALALTYQDFAANGDGGQLFPSTMLAAWASRGITPMLTWQPFDWYATGPQPAYSLANILAGKFDTYIKTWIAGAKAYGKPLYIRLMHEMNGDWYPWGQGLNGNTPARFVSAWRHIVTLFRAGGATNVRWVWSPNTIDTPTDPAQYPLTGLYPGDGWVDMIALDGYNWGTVGYGTAGWRSFTEVFARTYAAVAGINKPLIIAETGTTAAGGDKAAWITSAFTTEINSFPRVSAVIYFDVNGIYDDNWKVYAPTTVLAAYRAVVASTAWSAAFP
jgi:beta-mannanase